MHMYTVWHIVGKSLLKVSFGNFLFVFIEAKKYQFFVWKSPMRHILMIFKHYDTNFKTAYLVVL